MTAVFAAEREPRVWISPPIVEGERAAISWWCALVEDGEEATLAGTSMLRFAPDGAVREQWDAWNALDRHERPPAGWSPFADRDA